MRILFDQGTPLPLRSWLASHEVETTWQRGWSTLANGDLLLAAEKAGFNLFVTTDQQLRYQQNLTERSLAILVLMVANWPMIKSEAAALAARVEIMQPGEYAEWSPR